MKYQTHHTPISRIHIHSPELRVPTESEGSCVENSIQTWILSVQLFNINNILIIKIHIILLVHHTYPVIIEVGNVTADLPLPRKAHGNFSSTFPGSRSRISIV